MLKGRNWKPRWQSCKAVNTGYWHVFWGPFRFLSKEGSCMVFSGRLTVLHRHATQLRHRQSRQQLLVPLYSLCSFSFTLRFWHELAYLTFWEVGAEAKTEIFFFSWNNGFKCKIRGQGRRQEGRRLQPLRPSHFLIQESQHFPWSIASYKTLLFLVWTWIYRRLEFRCLFLSHFSLTPFFFPSIK